MIKRTYYQPVVCDDGFKMSVQAGKANLCTPRLEPESIDKYTHVEVGFPNRCEALLLEWAEDSERPKDTIYGYVPVERVALVCAKHGGIVSGELPPGVVYLDSPKKVT